MRICLVVESFESFGGMEEIIAALAITLKERGHDICVFSTIWIAPSNQYLRSLRQAGVTVMQLPAQPMFRLLAVMRAWLPAMLKSGNFRLASHAYHQAVADISQQQGWRYLLSPAYKAVSTGVLRLCCAFWRPDVLHFHSYTYKIGLTFLLEPARALHLPTVFQEHQTPDPSAPQWREFQRQINQATAVAAVSSRSAEVLHHFLGVSVPIHIVNPIVAVQAASGEPLEPQDEPCILRVGCIARLIPIKGLEYLLQAFAELRQHYAHIELRIYGDGPLRGELSGIAQQLGLDAGAVFVGAFHHDELAAILSHTDIFVLPSLREGLPLSIIEAMAHGLPILASRVGGIPELIEHGDSGLLCQAGDSAALAAGLRTLIDDRSLRMQLGNSARRCFEASEFSAAQVSARFEKIYQGLLYNGATSLQARNVKETL